MKLVKAEKILRKDNLAQLKKKGGFISTYGRVTVAIMPTCRNKARIAWAICSTKDKPRRKIGEMYALSRVLSGYGLPIEISEEIMLNSLAMSFADLVADSSEDSFKFED